MLATLPCFVTSRVGRRLSVCPTEVPAARRVSDVRASAGSGDSATLWPYGSGAPPRRRRPARGAVGALPRRRAPGLPAPAACAALRRTAAVDPTASTRAG